MTKPEVGRSLGPQPRPTILKALFWATHTVPGNEYSMNTQFLAKYSMWREKKQTKKMYAVK